MELIDQFQIGRRDLVATIAELIGAASLPADALAAPRRKRRGAARAGGMTPVQFATFSAVADTIIPATDTPGAVGAGVPRVFDGLIRNWASAAHRTMLLGEIDAIDTMARNADGSDFTALAPDRRKELLLRHDSEALKLGGKPERPANAFEAMFLGPPVTNPAWVRLKALVINTYYNSEVACTQELIYEHVPGQWVPSLKVTPETRPWSSAGPF